MNDRQANLTALIDALQAFGNEHPDNKYVDDALEGILEGSIHSLLKAAETSGNKAEALNKLVALADSFPERALIYAHISGVLIQLQLFMDARSFAEMGLRVAPDNPDLLFNYARCLMEFQDYDKAVTHFKRVLATNPDLPWAYVNIGECFRRLGEPEAAETYLQLARRRYPGFAPAYHNLAMLAMDQGEWEACAHYASTAVRLDPFDSDLRLALGDAFLALERWEEALFHLQHGTILDPFDPELYESLSVAFAELGKLHLAEGAAREALALDPESWRAYGNLAFIHGKRNDHRAVIDASLQALRCNPDDVGRQHLYWDMGWSYLQIGEYDQALKYAEKALEFGEEPELQLNKSLALLALGREKEAASLFHETFDDVENLEVLYDEMEGLEEAHGRFSAVLAGREEVTEYPRYRMEIHMITYEKGFFNVPVAYDDYVTRQEGAMDIRIDDQILIGRVTRKANPNGTARIFGGAALRDWFQMHFKLGDKACVEFMSPKQVRISKP